MTSPSKEAGDDTYPANHPLTDETGPSLRHRGEVEFSRWPHGIRQDLFGIIDVLALDPECGSGYTGKWEPDEPWWLVLVF